MGADLNLINCSHIKPETIHLAHAKIMGAHGDTKNFIFTTKFLLVDLVIIIIINIRVVLFMS